MGNASSSKPWFEIKEDPFVFLNVVDLETFALMSGCMVKGILPIRSSTDSCVAVETEIRKTVIVSCRINSHQRIRQRQECGKNSNVSSLRGD
jgi:hypothetical protein